MDDLIKILVVEDSATDAELVIRQLSRDGLQVEARCVDTSEDYLAELENFKPEIILCDFSMPRFEGFSAMAIAHARYQTIPFIFLSGTIGEDAAVDALKRGAVDYILKSHLHRLAPAVRRALKEARVTAAHLQAESRFHDLIEFAPHAIVVVNERGLIEIVNARAESQFGYARDEMIGTSTDRLIPARFQQWRDALKSNTDNWCDPDASDQGFEAAGMRRDGSEFPVEVNMIPLKTDDGRWISNVIRDISVRKEQEAKIARLSRIHTVLSGINTAIVRINDKARFLDEACRIAVEDGLFAGAWIGILDRDTQHVEPKAWAGIDEDLLMQLHISADPDSPWASGPTCTALRTGTSTVINEAWDDTRTMPWREMLIDREYRSICSMPLVVGSQTVGALVLYATQTGVFNDEELHLLSTVAADIAFALDHFSKEDRLNYLAYFDLVTGLPNRSLYQDRLTQLIAFDKEMRREPVAVVLLGLDRFRNINETFGRSAADELLREVARRLSDTLSETAYLARIYSDCFAFVVRGSPHETDVVNLLERKVFTCLAKPVRFLGKDVRVSATAGIVFFPTDGDDVEILLRNAEAALKNAKSSKAAYLFYATEMNARAAEKLSIENRLRRALDHEQFVLHYQPKFDLASGAIVGLEALIRWDEPGVGLVLPEKFIHILEETGLIVEVGNWVITRAHQQYREWVSRGVAPPRIAVNVSQLQIRQKGFVHHTLSMLDEVDPGEFELEITESLFMESADQDATKHKLVALRENGITMAIDDFGTGYSSLSYIARLPIDTLKIDRSFVTDMASSRDNMAIVSTIISLAHSLNLKVVAEGVETMEQFQLLRSLGCDQVQGYLYSRTLPPEQIEPRLGLRAA